MNQGPSSAPAGQASFSFTHKLLLTALVVILLVVVYTVVKLAFQVLLVFFAAILFGVLLHGLSSWLHRKTRLPYSWALGLVCLLMAGLVVTAFLTLGPSLSEQAVELREDLPVVLQKLEEKIKSLPLGDQIIQQLPTQQEMMGSKGTSFKNAIALFSSSLGALANILIVLVIGIYLASSPQEAASGIVRLVPKASRPRAREVVHVLRFTLWGWLKGTLLAMLIIGTLTSIGLMIIGVPMPLLLGVFAGLLEFVPNLGPFIAAAPAILLALVDDPNKALTVVIFFIALQSLEGYVLTPLVQKRIIDLPPVLTIMGQVLMGIIAGPWGLLLAVPVVAVITVLVKMLYIEDVLGDQGVEVKGEEEAIEKEEKSPTPPEEQE
ncbi:AI-2E family transporter [Nibribacter ruber]|uniref:AI-2E family transporter n=1 Tax=Nibribacter ruber TaxID=2698458 RepID=A0A6P1NWU2_9BACT|nr:AI-2E family transporter [Nibribacter ruber]QHL88336.1 AI-2E family transporter [Nibribacter ruber]